MAHIYTIRYIDESSTDRNEYTDRLGKTGLVEVCSSPPPEHLTRKVFKEYTEDLLLVDYLLDQQSESGPLIEYRGSSFAAMAREQDPLRPIVLFTRRAYEQVDLPRARDVQGAYDEILFKDSLQTDPGPLQTAKQLVSLIEGFGMLAAVEEKNWEGLLRTLGANESEAHSLREAQPPGGRTEPWRVPEAARWILKVICNYPGILYDSLHASAALGISQEDFASESVQASFRPARYSGPFASSDDPRWWKQRFLERAYGLMKEAEVWEDVAVGFSLAWNKAKGAELQPSVCVWSGETHADCVCYWLKKPVKRRYSLPIIPDDRPAIMETARISFKAIREGNFDERWFREDAEELVRSIREKGAVNAGE